MRMISLNRIRRLAVIFSLAGLILSACSGKTSPDAGSPIPIASLTAPNPASATTRNATSGPAGASSTATPASSPTHKLPASPQSVPTETENLLTMPLPEGTPSESWKGIPIMPAALAGEEGEGNYAYTVQAETVDIQSFYETQMAALGWTLSHTGTSEQGAVILLFTKENQVATITVAPQPEGFLLVLLVV